MEENLATAEGSSQGAPAAQMNFGQRLNGIYFEPKKTFEDINRRGSWLGIFVLISLVSMASSYVLTTRLDRETILRKALLMSPVTRAVPADQMEKLIQQRLANPPGLLEQFSFLSVPVSLIVYYSILAGIITLLLILFGASIRFKKALGVTIWGMAAPSLILTLLAILLMFLKDPQSIEINPAANVASNLGFLINEELHPVLASLLGSIDLFSLWIIALLALGFSSISEKRLSAGKAAGGIVALWLVYVLGKAAITGGLAMFGQA
jgi:hypothetical protein